MRLITFGPKFVRYETNGAHLFYRYVDTIAEAQGVLFRCPKCYAENDGPVGTHMVICWTRAVPDNAAPGPGRWAMTGRDFYDLTLAGDGGPDSILLQSGCHWHGYVRAGEIFNA